MLEWFSIQICVDFENLPKLSWNIFLGITGLKFPFNSHALSARTDKIFQKSGLFSCLPKVDHVINWRKRPISMLIAVIFCAELTMTHKIFIVES